MHWRPQGGPTSQVLRRGAHDNLKVTALAQHRPSTSHAACEFARTTENDTEGIRTPAGRAQWISSPSP